MQNTVHLRISIDLNIEDSDWTKIDDGYVYIEMMDKKFSHS